MKKRFGIIAVLLIGSLLLTSCTIFEDSGQNSGDGKGPETSENGAVLETDELTGEQMAADASYRKIDDIMDKGPVHGGTLNLFMTSPDTFNPLYTKNTYVRDFLGLVYEGLTKLNAKQETIPVLSDKWTVSADGLIWNFHIRDGVKWQDGKPLTAEDVEFTMNTILSTQTDSQYKELLNNVATFAAADARNFKIVLLKPNSFLAGLMCFPILPKHQFESNAAGNSGVNFKPVGTGAFSFSEYEKDKNVLLAVNKNWWFLNTVEKPGELLYLDRINIKVYNSAKEAIDAFQTGDIDISPIDTADIGKYYGRTDLIIKKFTSRNFEFLAFNTAGKVTGEASVRNAVSKAIDRKSIISRQLNDCAVEADFPISPDYWLFNEIPGGVTQTATVQSVLEADGWKQGEKNYYKNAGGVRKNLELELLAANGNAQRIRIAEQICEQLKVAGIPATVVKLDWDEMMDRIRKKKFDMVILGLRTDRTPDLTALYSTDGLTGYTPSKGDGIWNVAGYNNPEVTLNLQNILSENSSAIQKVYFENAKKIINAEHPYIGLFFLQDAMIYRKNVRGLLAPNIWDKYYDITRWYIPSLQ